MPLALALTIIAALLFIITVLIAVIVTRRGVGIKTVYVYPGSPDEENVIPGEVIKEDDTAFFDENDLAAMEAKEERPEFVATEIWVNGVKAGRDGVIPEEKEKGWLRR